MGEKKTKERRVGGKKEKEKNRRSPQFTFLSTPLQHEIPIYHVSIFHLPSLSPCVPNHCQPTLLTSSILRRLYSNGTAVTRKTHFRECSFCPPVPP